MYHFTKPFQIKTNLLFLMNKHRRPPSQCTRTPLPQRAGHSYTFQTDMNLSQSSDDNLELRLVDGSGSEMPAMISDWK